MLLTLLTSFWIWDTSVMPPVTRQAEVVRVATSAVATGDEVDIFVEKDAKVDEQAVRDLMKILIPGLDKELKTFGPQPTPPSKDRGFYVVIARIPPYVNKKGTTFRFDGFFSGLDQTTEEHSNQRNIIYVNSEQDLGTDYIRAVVLHELAHLLTFGRENQEQPLGHWLNEMLGEAAMEMNGFYTDTSHVDRYRAKVDRPLAATGYGMSYGAVAMFGEFLLKHYPAELLGKLPAATGTDFSKLETVYGKPWSELFEQYVTWLYEQTPPSGFTGLPVSAHPNTAKMSVAPSGVLYLDGPVGQLQITATPESCKASRNMLRNKLVTRDGHAAAAVWVESAPPCISEKDSFVIE